MNEDPNRRKKDIAAGAGVGAAGAGLAYGAYRGNQAVQRAGGYKAVGSKAYGTAKEAASQGAGYAKALPGKAKAAGESLYGGATTKIDEARVAARPKIIAAKSKMSDASDFIGAKAGEAKRALRVGRIAAKKGLRKGGRIGKAVAKMFSDADTKRIINLEARLDDALGL